MRLPLSYSNRKQLLHVENKMEEPLGLAGPPQYTLHKTMLFIVFLNGIFGLCGYARFGDTSQGSIAMNLPPGNLLVYRICILLYHNVTVWIVHQFL